MPLSHLSQYLWRHVKPPALSIPASYIGPMGSTDSLDCGCLITILTIVLASDLYWIWWHFLTRRCWIHLCRFLNISAPNVAKSSSHSSRIWALGCHSSLYSSLQFWWPKYLAHWRYSASRLVVRMHTPFQVLISETSVTINWRPWRCASFVLCVRLMLHSCACSLSLSWCRCAWGCQLNGSWNYADFDQVQASAARDWC